MGFIFALITCFLAFSIDKYQRENKSLKNTIKDLTEENKTLKTIVKKLNDYIAGKESGESLNIQNTIGINNREEQVKNAEVVTSEKKETVTYSMPREEVIQKTQQVKNEARVEQRKEYDREKIKNTTILLTGAFLIILAAIILLLSTWNIMPNFIKTVVLFMFAGVFFGISKKAEKMGLNDTSRTFFNLAMAYMPICLISVSLFGLLGEFLSITGDGKFIYLTAVFLAIAGIYYKFSKVKDSKGLYYSSILSQLFTVVLFSLIFEKNINLILLNLSLYNILLMLAPKKDDLMKLLSLVLMYLALSISSIVTLIGACNLLTLLTLSAIFVGFAILINKKPVFASGISMNYTLAMLLLTILQLPILKFSLGVKHLLFIIGIFAILIIEENLLSRSAFKRVKYSNYIIGYISLVITLLISLISKDEVIVKFYIISLLLTGLSIIIYLKYKKEFFAVSMPITFYFFVSSLITHFTSNLNYHANMIAAIMQFIVFKLFAMTNKESRNVLEPTINILLGVIITLIFADFSEAIKNDFGYFLVIFGLYAFSERSSKTKNEEIVYRILSYCSSYFVISSLFELILEKPDTLIAYIPLIISIIAIILENINEEFDDTPNKFIINVSGIISCMFIAATEGIIHGVMLGISGLGILVYNRIRNEKEELDLPVMLTVFLMTLFRDCGEDILEMIFMLIYTGYSTILGVSKRKINFYAIMSYVYLFNFMEMCENGYINTLVFLINSLIYIPYMKVEKERDVFRFLSIASGLAFYLNFVNDFVKVELVSIKLFGWLVFSIYSYKNILVKYIKEIKPIRIITFVVLYLYGMLDSEGMADTMLIMLMQFVIIIYSYNQRLESEFIASIVMLAFNAFLLTASFWFSIPWWIYFIIVGGALISFGIRNESKEKNNNVTLKEMYYKRFKN